jgi:hypothetical protein
MVDRLHGVGIANGASIMGAKKFEMKVERLYAINTKTAEIANTPAGNNRFIGVSPFNHLVNDLWKYLFD